jgi:hypothetical protein
MARTGIRYTDSQGRVARMRVDYRRRSLFIRAARHVIGSQDTIPLSCPETWRLR